MFGQNFVAEIFAQSRHGIREHFLQACLFHSGGIQAQAYVARIGQIGQMQLRWQCIFDIGNSLCKVTLGYVGDYQRGMQDGGCLAEVIQQTWQNLL